MARSFVQCEWLNIKLCEWMLKATEQNDPVPVDLFINAERVGMTNAEIVQLIKFPNMYWFHFWGS